MVDKVADMPMLARVKSLVEPSHKKGLTPYYQSKIEELEIKIMEKKNNNQRIQAQRNELNNCVKALKEEYQALLRSPANVTEVVKMMGNDKCMVKAHGDEKSINFVDSKVEKSELVPNARVAVNDA